MKGIERLRELGREQEERSWSTVGKIRGRMMSEIADQIEREEDGHLSRMRVLSVVCDMERHVSGAEGAEDSPVARWSRELRKALGGGERDHAEDVSMSAYDLLSKEDREAIAWVREHGGIAYVKDAWNVRSNLDRQLEKAQAKVERQQRHIMFVQTKCRERQERIEELSRELDELDDICDGESVKDTLEEALNLCATIGCEPSSAVGEELIWALGECTKIVSERLMPEGGWPRYEDGEMALVGSEIADEIGCAHTVTSVEFFEDGVALRWNTDEPEEFVWLKHGERVKRPAPKVLDADGAEIREGDTVWDVYTGERMIVEGLKGTCGGYQTCLVTLESGEQTTCDGPRLSHRAPVLAADGRPLREGETVFDKDAGDRFEVNGFSDDGFVVCWDVDRCEADIEIKPSQLTHERPESWERLEDDATLAPASYCHDRGLAYARDPDPDAATYVEAMARDLVRRARALAERRQ